MNKNNAVEIVFWWTMFVSAFAVCSFIFSLIAINFQNNYVEECVSSHVETNYLINDSCDFVTANIPVTKTLNEYAQLVTVYETINVCKAEKIEKTVCDKVMLVRNVSEVK